MQDEKIKSLLESFIFVSESPVTSTQAYKVLYNFFNQENPQDSAENSNENENNSNQKSDLVLLENPESNQGVGPENTLQESPLTVSQITRLFKEIQETYAQDTDRGIDLVEVAGAWQFRTRVDNANFLKSAYQAKPTKLSKPALETLAIIAYKQPLTRAEIDEVRGVDSGGVLKKLLEKNLVRMMGKKEEAGKPILYGTTTAFLELFQLKSLKELPSLRDYSELEEEFFQAQSEKSEHGDSQESKLSELFGGSSLEQLEGLSEEENEVLDELEDSLKGLRQMEKSVFPPQSDSKNTETENEMEALLEASESPKEQSESV